MIKSSIAIFGALSDEKFKSKVEPLIDLELVSKVYLYRYSGNPINSKYTNKIIYFSKKRMHKYVYYIFVFFSMFNLALRGKINVLVGLYFYPFGILSGLVGFLMNKRYILILPGSDLKRILKDNTSHFLLKKSFRIGVRGNNSLSELEKLNIPSCKLFVLHNAFSLPSGPDIANKGKEWDIIYVGYFREGKRLDISIEVIKKLKNSIPNISAVFVGSGSEYNKIQRLIKQNSLEDNIFLAGYQKDVNFYLNKSRVFLLTSESEGLPMVLIESMSLGLPVVTSNINDISDVVKDGVNGYLISSMKEKDYTDALRAILEDNNRYEKLSLSARESMQCFHRQMGSFESVQNTWNRILSH